jgi:hypothetical protein
MRQAIIKKRGDLCRGGCKTPTGKGHILSWPLLFHLKKLRRKFMNIHPFEAAGLGTAPFKFVGSWRSIYVACQGAPAQPGSSCDYCGQSISDVYDILSADGKRFHVGSDCVMKVYARSDIGVDDVAKDVAAAKRVLGREKREEKSKRDWDDVNATWDNITQETKDRMGELPHPMGFSDRETGKPLTLWDWAEWMYNHAGLKGRKQVMKVIKKYEEGFQTQKKQEGGRS